MSTMDKHAGEQHGGIPRGVLLGAFALVCFSIIATAAARVSDVGTVHMPQRRAVETLALAFVDRDDGGIDVIDAIKGSSISSVEPGTNGFIRATLRGLVRERKRSNIGPATPFLLTRWNDGAITLEDRETNRKLDLDAFGPTNAGAFARLFNEEGRAR
jgi:putative photosynthetic complex assembly protein